MAVNWKSIKKDYVHGDYTSRELSEKHKVPEGTIRARISREDWATTRSEVQQKIVSAATEKLANRTVDELAKFNEDGIKLARAFNAQVAKHIQSAQAANRTIPPNEIRSLAATAEVAQRMGRLAMGQTTDNTGVSSPHGGAVEVMSMTPERYAKVAKEVLSKF